MLMCTYAGLDRRILLLERFCSAGLPVSASMKGGAVRNGDLPVFWSHKPRQPWQTEQQNQWAATRAPSSRRIMKCLRRSSLSGTFNIQVDDDFQGVDTFC
jgi:hypothetical protein